MYGEEMETRKKAADMSVKELASYIDQSVLKPEFTQDDIRKYIQEGIDYGCRTVCVNPASLDIAATTRSKCLQAEEYCRRGDIFELDVVANYGWIRSGMWDEVGADIRAVAEVCHKYGTALKVILETDALDAQQIAEATRVAVAAGADFVKSSTGFYTGGPCVGATEEVVAIMLENAEGKAKIKGSGCIRTREHFLKLIDMGIDRMGIGYKSTPVVLGISSK